MATQGARPACPNAERDCHTAFRRLGLSVPVKIERAIFTSGAERVETHYIHIQSWLSFLLARHPSVLCGGAASMETQLESFWAMYQWSHPDHCVFGQDSSRLCRTIPIMLFGDEGKGPKRGNYMLTTFESPIGAQPLAQAPACDCQDFVNQHLASVPDCYGDAAVQPETVVAADMALNLGSSSFVTRHLLFGLPDTIYKPHPDVFQKLLHVVSTDLISLFRDGILVNGKRWFAALVATKGDMKHMCEKWAHLTRSYSHLGRVNCIEMCSLCLAGQQQYPFDELSARPRWVSSLFSSRPWNVTPSICQVPFDVRKPEYVLRLDLFHVVKVGIGRDVAGAIVLLSRLGIYDQHGASASLNARLERAHQHFRLWALSVHKTPALRYFSVHLFNIKRATDFPWANTKASDTVLLLEYLEWHAALLLSNLPPHLLQHRTLLKLLKSTTRHCLQLLSIAYGHSLWLERPCAQAFYLHTMSFLSGYQAMAKLVLQQGMFAFAIKPKYHALHHIAWEVCECLGTTAPRVLNPACFSCDMGEDTIGKICSLALVVSTRTINKRVIDRHFLKKAACLRRHSNFRRSRGWHP